MQSCVLGLAYAESDSEDGRQLQPSISLHGVYRTNVYLQEGEIGGGDPVTSGTYLTARPRVDLLFNDSSIAHLKLSAGYTARKYLDSSLSNLDRFNDFDAKTGIELYPKRAFGITLKDAISMRGFETEAVYADSAYLRRLENRLLAMANVRPGPALSLSGGASLDFEDYRNDRGTSPLDVPNLNKRLSWGPRIDLDWNFLPRTAVLLDYSYSQFFWQDNFVYAIGGGLNPTDDLGERLGVPNGYMSQLTTGLEGQISRRVSLGLVGGVTSMVYDEDSVLEDAGNDGIDGASSDIDTASQGFGADLKLRCKDGDEYCEGFPSSLTAKVNLGIDISEESRIALTYRRDFQDVFFTNYVAFNQFTLLADLSLGQRVGLDLVADYRIEDYQGEVDRTDDFIRVRANSQIDLVKSSEGTITLDLGVGWVRRTGSIFVDVSERNSTIEFDDLSVTGGISLRR